jgi:hypothetical protein
VEGANATESRVVDALPRVIGTAARAFGRCAPFVSASITPDCARYFLNSSFLASGACAWQQHQRGASGSRWERPRQRHRMRESTHLKLVGHAGAKTMDERDPNGTRGHGRVWTGAAVGLRSGRL